MGERNALTKAPAITIEAHPGSMIGGGLSRGATGELFELCFDRIAVADNAQLQLADVREQHDTWIMHITELGDGDKWTKTAGSMRVVPIHSELIKLGFVDHCKAMAKGGHKQVFPEVEIPADGQIIPEFSRAVTRTYLPRIGLKNDRTIVVYSLRHTVVDRMRLAGFMDDEIGMIIGHDKATMTGPYGVEQEGTLKRRAELVESTAY